MNTTQDANGPAYPSFVAVHVDRPDVPKSWWNVRPSGDYGADYATGERLATEYITIEKASRGPGWLAHIVEVMPRGDELTGVEIGFLQHIARSM